MSLLNLPVEIQAEILMKLPVDSILTCKYLCKLWFTLVSSPEFIKNHLHLTTQRNRNFRLMLSQWSNQADGAKPVISSIDYASILPLSLACQSDGYVPMDYHISPFRYEDVMAVRILGSCNGLICLRIVWRDSISKDIYIWNPSTKEYKRVPECDVSTPNSFGFKCGFGFDKTINDYKVVRIPYGLDGTCSSIQVYNLGLNSWRNVQTITYWLNWKHEFLQWKFLGSSLFFNGALHWLDLTTQGTPSDFIASFELGNERFVQFPFPKEHMNNFKRAYKSVGVLGDCICLSIGYNSDYRTLGGCVDIWVMQDYGVQESWTKRFTITQLATGHLPCKPIWSFENGEILLDTRSDLISYDPNSGKVRMVSPSDVHMNRHVVIYVETLASVNSNTYTRR